MNTSNLKDRLFHNLVANTYILKIFYIKSKVCLLVGKKKMDNTCNI